MPPGFHEMNLGDNRGFSPTAGTGEFAVAVVVDYETHHRDAAEPVVNATNGEILTGHPDVTATQQSNCLVLLHYNTADRHAFGGEGVSKGVPISVNGTLGIQLGANGPRSAARLPRSRSSGTHGERPGLDQTSLAAVVALVRRRGDGAVGGLWAHKTVGHYASSRASTTCSRC